ncbi:MAG: Crp/Fnr family transcriptional regulator [Prolixibacteraceae bacterium]|nr:Crp/Fnr family transcriptional regulator [Prolixibacteraceae bacterium]
MEAFRNFLNKYTSIPENEWQQIWSAFEMKKFRKNEMILSEGQICRFFYFMELGMIRFFINNDGEEITKFFTVAPYCFTSKESFRNQKPATENIQALENIVAWQINLGQANKLLKLKSWESFTRKFMHEVQTYTEELLLESKTQTAEQRYFNLQQKYPELINKIPLKHLASFLGIAPQSLSRIRNRNK